MPGGANATINCVKGAGDPAAVFGNRSEIFRGSGRAIHAATLGNFPDMPEGEDPGKQERAQVVQTTGQAGRSYHKNKFLRSLLRRKQGSTRRKNPACTCTDRGQKSDTSPALLPWLPLHDPLSAFRPQRLKLPRKPIIKDSENRSSKTRPGISTGTRKKWEEKIHGSRKKWV